MEALESKPDIVSTVVANLPEEVFMESIEKHSFTISSSTKCMHEKESEIVDVTRELC